MYICTHVYLLVWGDGQSEINSYLRLTVIRLMLSVDKTDLFTVTKRVSMLACCLC